MPPAVSEKQRRYFGAELGRAEKGEATQTGLPVDKLKDFARKPVQLERREERLGRDLDHDQEKGESRQHRGAVLRRTPSRGNSRR